MEDSTVVELYEWLDEMTELVEKETDEPYLDSLAIVLEAIFHGEVRDEAYESIRQTVTDTLQRVNVDDYDAITIRKAIQLAVLKGMKDGTQPHHEMTPEAIALFVGYLTEKFVHEKERVRLFDPASGTGNLLLTVMEHLEKGIEAYASEIDPTLIKISLYNANLQKKRVEYFHQDSLSPFLLDPVDVVVSDLPIGYYPDDVRARDFALRAEKGHSYAHHLFIEQSLTYTKPGGYLILLVPEFLFESEEAEKLHTFLQKEAHVIGLLQLPNSAFKSNANKKSIFVLRKKGRHVDGVQQPLLAMLPSFSNTSAMEDILQKINSWFEENKARL
ncbi:MAG TPA: class I SAM-dependent methyltransferase [Pseudogracilibacillus sp.]|nr:class I SAM-dependent methyltransferase [Pseudogracilibacillus sp.]